jgi:hypothetical protein
VRAVVLPHHRNLTGLEGIEDADGEDVAGKASDLVFISPLERYGFVVGGELAAGASAAS